MPDELRHINQTGELLHPEILPEPEEKLDFSPEDRKFIHSLGGEKQKPRKRDTTLDRIEKFLLQKYRFRFNIVCSRLEYQLLRKEPAAGEEDTVEEPVEGPWEPMTDYVENSILCELIKSKIKVNGTILRSLLRSDFSRTWDPFEDYFSKLPPWDGQTDYIGMLAQTVTTTRPELWDRCLRKWITAMVGSVLDRKVTNQTVIIFTGDHGIGKTSWIEKLVPTELKAYYYSGNVNPGDRETLTHMTECMLINLDELENLNRSETGDLKELITKSQIRLRRVYGHNHELLPRRASFAGSVNLAQFLHDTTGSRRFLCFEVMGIEYQHSVPIDLVLAQALSLFRNGFCYWFNQQEIAEVEENNEKYRVRTREEEMLLTYFEPCTREEADVFLNATQVAERLNKRARFQIGASTVNNLGKALTKNKFLRIRSNGWQSYAVRELSDEEVEKRQRGISQFENLKI